MTKKKMFNSMEAGYDYGTARKENVSSVSDEFGNAHWPSRAPKTGTILKGRMLKSDDGVNSFGKTQIGEELRDYDITFEKGRYVSKKRKKEK